MGLADEIKSFFDCFEDTLEFKTGVINKTEYYFLTYRNRPLDGCLKSVKTSLGRTAVNALYYNQYDLITRILVDDSETIMNAPQNILSWLPLYNVAREILSNDDCHPYLLLLLKEIVNTYKCLEKENAPQFYGNDYFKKIGCSYIAIKEKAVSFLHLYERVDDVQEVIRLSFEQEILSTGYPLIQCLEMAPAEADCNKNEKQLWTVLSPQRPEDIVAFLLSKYLETNLWFRRCENCKRFFVTTAQSNARFCEHILEGRGRNCRQLMPKVNLLNKSKEDPAAWLFNRAYKTMYSRVTSGNLTKAAYKEWSKEARTKRDECSKGVMTPEEYSEWLSDSGLFIDYLKDT